MKTNRWSFRTRLTALIAVIFVAGGFTLLAVQYVMVSGLLSRGVDSAISNVEVATAASAQSGDAADPESFMFPADPESMTDDSMRRALAPTTQGGELLNQSFGTTADSAPLDEGQLRQGSNLADTEPMSGLTEHWSGTQDLGTPLMVEQVDGGFAVFVRSEVNQLSGDVLRGLALGSVVTLLGFAGLAVIAAQWLSRRSLDRIGQITAMTRKINREGLNRRLSLTGPKDEVKELGDTIDAMLERLEESFAQQDRFISGASHELRTPLTTTRSALEIPLAQGLVPAEIEPDLRRALAANRRSERLIAAFLALARTTHQQGSASLESVNVQAVVQELLVDDKYLTRAEAKGVTVKQDLDPAVVCVTESDLLGIAIRNVIDNSIRHNREGGQVDMHLFATSAMMVFEVANDGEVLSEEDVCRLVEPFNRGAQTRLSGEGVGLGLTLTDSIAKRLGGELWLQARAEGGVLVRLSVPLGTTGQAPDGIPVE